MTDRPILMSAPMVRALLAGTKTQTRRVVNPQPERSGDGVLMWGASRRGMRFGVQGMDIPPGVFARCPYGQPGDRLWVKETWRTAKSLDARSPAAIGEMCIDAGYRKPWAPLAYEADGHRNSEWRGFELDGDAEPGKTRVSIHMPRWASRITLEVTGVRVERLMDISSDAAAAEGWPGPDAENSIQSAYPIAWYSQLWEQINGPGSWEANPWVWCIDFRRVPPLAQGPE